MTSASGNPDWLDCKCGGYPYTRQRTKDGVTGREVECKECGFFDWWPSTQEAKDGWNKTRGFDFRMVNGWKIFKEDEQWFLSKSGIKIKFETEDDAIRIARRTC